MQTIDRKPIFTGNLASPEARKELITTIFIVRPVSSKILNANTDAPILMTSGLSVKTCIRGLRNSVTTATIIIVKTNAARTLFHS